MIETISTNENLPINKGEGAEPSPPPSSSEVKAPTKSGVTGQTKTGQVKKDAAVELAPEIKDAVESENRNEDEGKTVEKELRETIERLNDKLSRLDREVLLKLDQRIGKNYVSVVDKQSQEVIREFPPKEIRSFIARFMEFNEKMAANTDIRSLIINLEV
jgi:flagellar protein FlaG